MVIKAFALTVFARSPVVSADRSRACTIETPQAAPTQWFCAGRWPQWTQVSANRGVCHVRSKLLGVAADIWRDVRRAVGLTRVLLVRLGALFPLRKASYNARKLTCKAGYASCYVE